MKKANLVAWTCSCLGVAWGACALPHAHGGASVVKDPGQDKAAGKDPNNAATQPAASGPAGAPPMQQRAVYSLYWLTRAERSEYIDLLISTRPIGELAATGIDSNKMLADATAILVTTYAKDSIWNVDRRPFKGIQAVKGLDVDKRTLELDGREYTYASATLREVIALLEKPRGTIEIHRIYAPIEGGEIIAAGLLARLKDQFEHEKRNSMNVTTAPAAQPAKAGAADALFPYRLGDRWGYIDARGTWVIAPSFKEAGEFNDGLAAVETPEGGWGYVDRTGKLAIGGKFYAAYPFSDGLALVQERSAGKPRYLFVNAKGETVAVVDKYAWVCRQFSEGRVGFCADYDRGGDRYGFLDYQGRVAVKPISTVSRLFSGGLAVVKIDGKCGYVNRQGELAIQPRFDHADSFVDGLAPVAVDGKYGYIDAQGKFVIDPKFRGANPFSEGLAAVVDGNAWAFIDKTGEIRFKPPCPLFGQNLMFSDGVCVVMDGTLENPAWSLIDTQGKVIGRFAEKGDYRIGAFKAGLAPLFFNANPGRNQVIWEHVGYVRKTGERVSVAEPARPATQPLLGTRPAKPTAADLEETVRLVTKAVGGKWAISTAKDYPVDLLSGHVPTDEGSDQVYFLFPVAYDESGRKILRLFRKQIISLQYRTLGHNDWCTVAVYGSTQSKASRAIIDALRLTVLRPTPESAERAERIRKGFHDLDFSLLYGGPDKGRPSIRLRYVPDGNQPAIVRSGADMEDVNMLISKAQAGRILRIIDGYLDLMEDRETRGRMPVGAREEPGYRMGFVGSIDGDRGREEFGAGASLGWGPEMFAHLDALRAVLEGDAAKAMDEMLARLEPLRREWQGSSTRPVGAPATKPATRSTGSGQAQPASAPAAELAEEEARILAARLVNEYLAGKE